MPSRPDIRLDVDKLALSRGDLPLIGGLKFSLGAGEALWLTGPNGIGKTSLLLACAGFLAADDGHVRWSLGGDSRQARDLVAYSAHRGPERSGLTLGEDLAFWQSLYDDDRSMEERLRGVGLLGRHNTPVAGLSAGQKRRLGLARLLSSGRPAWLMDEPLSGLDVEGQALVTRAVGEHLAEGGLALIASHQPVPIQGVTARKLVMTASPVEGAA
ncbi:MAG: heme ABC exporter ATP-binding protein CcmA [Litorimonas sp.]